MRKQLELSQKTSCLNKANSLEPLFVLRAKDPMAAQTVRHWATMAEGTHEQSKIDEAKQIADDMDKYRAAMKAPSVSAE